MLKTSEFIQSYKEGKLKESTLIKMAALKGELEKLSAEGKLDEFVKEAITINPRLRQMVDVRKTMKTFTPEMQEYIAANINKFIKPIINPSRAARSIEPLTEASKYLPNSESMWERFLGAGGKIGRGIHNLSTLVSDASKSPIGQVMLGSLVVGGSLMAFQEVVKSIEGKVVDWSQDRKRPKLFEEMLALHPELGENRKRAELYYEALWHFSPVMASNPLAAGSYIKQALQYDHVAQGPLPASVQELTLIEKNKMQAEENAHGDSFMTTVLSPFSASAQSFGKK